MPTPVGHALAGLATGWLSDATAKKNAGPGGTQAFGALGGGLTLACVAAAVVPDVDILFHSHRTYSHSIGAVLMAGVAAWIVARRRTSPLVTPILAGLTVAIAYGTHVLLDWLAMDTAPPFGLMALWPFSSRFYLSGANLFFGVSRRYWRPQEFIVGNLIAVGWEVVVLAPIAAFAFWLRSKRLDR